MRSPSLHTRVFSVLFLLALLLALIPATPSVAAPAPDAPQPTVHEANPATSSLQPDTSFHSSPVMFIQNMGQWDERAAFQVWGGPAGTMWIAKDGSMWLTLMERPHPSQAQDRFPFSFEPSTFNPSSDRQPVRGVNLKLTFVGANPAPRLEPFDRLDTVVSYFIGADESQWHPDVPVWGGVRLMDLYPGVDLEITSEWGGIPEDGSKPEAPPQRVFAWRLVCRADCAGALENVRLRVEGADALEVVTLDGSEEARYLRVHTEMGEVTLPLLGVKGAAGPQVQGDMAPRVAGNDVLRPLGTGTMPQREMGVAGGGLVWSTFLGGNGDDTAIRIAVDGSGYAYVTGRTYSSNFPTTWGAFDRSHNDEEDAFVVKISRDGSSLVYATFLGGSGSDHGIDIAVDGSGYAYVTGNTTSSNFPTTWGAFDRSHNGEKDAFVVKVSRDGSSLVYATFLGGSADDGGYGIAVDGSGYAFVTGHTLSSNFPTTWGAFDRSLNGYWDAFVVKVNNDGSSLVYATFLGGSDWDTCTGIAVDGSGHAYITGMTSSEDFPTTPNVFDRSYNGSYFDAFVVKMSGDGSSLVYATFLGGNSLDRGHAIAVDGSGHAYVTGYTYSSDFPTISGAFDSGHNGGRDAFVVKMSRDGNSLVYATFLGGSNDDGGFGIVVDGSGYAYVRGRTRSSDFPTTSGAFDRSYNGGYDAFVVKVSGDGGSLVYATFLGGSYDDEGYGIAVDDSGHAYVTGYTASSNFPTTSGAFDRSYNGGDHDVFVARFNLGAPPPNDDINNATVIPASSSSFSRTYTQDTTNATTAWDDPYFTCVSGQKYHTVWYRITPAVDGTLTVDTNGSDYDTVLAVWRGSRGNLTSVGCNDDGGSGSQSYLQVDVRANTTYYIEVAGYGSGDAGNLTLHVSFERAADTTPPSISNIRESNDPINRQGCPSPTTTVIRANVSDASGLAWVRLYYKAPGSNTWQYKTMSRESGLTYKATLGPFSSAGTARYYIQARDTAGNERSSSTYTVTVRDCDTTPPSISNVRESNDPINREGCAAPTTTVIRADVSDASGLAWVRLYYQAPGSSTWQYKTMSRESGSTYRATLGPFSSAGTARYYIKAKDNADNTNYTSTYTVTVRDCDTTPPSISNVRESNDPINREGCAAPTTTVIRTDVSDASGLAWVRLYYKVPGSSTWQYKTMSRESGSTYKATLGPFSSAGTARYYIKARDNAGNERSSSTYTVTVRDCDTTPPSIENVRRDRTSIGRRGCPVAVSTNVRADVSDASGLAWVRLYYLPPNSSTWQHRTMPLESGHTYKAPLGPFDDPGTVQYYVQAQDSAGNTSKSSVYTITVTDCDTTPPRINNIRESNDPINRQGCTSPTTTAIRADISDASDLAWVRLYYKESENSIWKYTPMRRESGNTYKAILGPFDLEGTVRYHIQAEDSAGNRAETPSYTLTVRSCPAFHLTLIAPDKMPQEQSLTVHLKVENWGRGSGTVTAFVTLKDEEGNTLETETVSVTVDGGQERLQAVDFGKRPTGTYRVEAYLRYAGQSFNWQMRKVQVLNPAAVRIILKNTDPLIGAANSELTEIGYTAADVYADMGVELISEMIQSTASDILESLIDAFVKAGALPDDAKELIAGFVEHQIAALMNTMVRCEGTIDSKTCISAMYYEEQFEPYYLSPRRRLLASRYAQFEDFLKVQEPASIPDGLDVLVQHGRSRLRNVREHDVIQHYEFSLLGRTYTYDMTMPDQVKLYYYMKKARNLVGIVTLVLIVFGLILVVAEAVSAIPTWGATLAAIPVTVVSVIKALIGVSATFFILTMFAGLGVGGSVEILAPRVPEYFGNTLQAVETLVRQEGGQSAGVVNMRNILVAPDGVAFEVEATGKDGAPVKGLLEIATYSVDGSIVDLRWVPVDTEKGGVTRWQGHLALQPGRYRTVATLYAGGSVVDAQSQRFEVTQPAVELSVTLQDAQVTLGESVRATLTITNTSTTEKAESLTLMAQTADGEHTNAWSVTLDPGESQQYTFEFTPTQEGAGQVRAWLVIGLSVLDQQNVAYVVGTAPAFTLDPGVKPIYEPLGPVTVPITLTNSGNASGEAHLLLETIDRLHPTTVVYTTTANATVAAGATVPVTATLVPDASPGLYTVNISLNGQPYGSWDFAVAAKDTLFGQIDVDSMYPSLGHTVVVTATVLNAENTPTDATITVTVLHPSGQTSTLTMNRVSTGRYRGTFTPATAGTYLLTLDVTKPGYRTLGDKIFVVADRPTLLVPEVQGNLIAHNLYPITVTVKTEAGVPVPDARVVISGTVDWLSGTTDGNGQVVFQFLPSRVETYRVIVEKMGYATATRKVQATGKLYVPVMVRLVSSNPSSAPTPTPTAIPTPTLTPTPSSTPTPTSTPTPMPTLTPTPTPTAGTPVYGQEKCSTFTVSDDTYIDTTSSGGHGSAQRLVVSNTSIAFLYAPLLEIPTGSLIT